MWMETSQPIAAPHPGVTDPPPTSPGFLRGPVALDPQCTHSSQHFVSCRITTPWGELYEDRDVRFMKGQGVNSLPLESFAPH